MQRNAACLRQVEAAEVFELIVKDRLMPPADLQVCLLPTVVRNVNKEKSEEVGACTLACRHARAHAGRGAAASQPAQWLTRRRAPGTQETSAWVKALCELIPVLDKETLKSQVMSMALSKGEVEDNANSRVICARILGALAPYLSKEEVERSFFKQAMTMCQVTVQPCCIRYGPPYHGMAW